MRIKLQQSAKTKAGLIRGLLVLAMMCGISFFSLASASITQAAESDGTVDPTFKSGSGPNHFVHSLATQNDGKIIIGGSFTSYNNSVSGGIARLNPDSSLDESFKTENGTNGTVYAIAIQNDGKIIIGGSFTIYNSKTVNRIARLNPDGSLDDSFNIGNGADYSVRAITIQDNGKVIIAGEFTSYNNRNSNHIVRLNPDGTLDSSFSPGDGTNYSVYALAIQNDGKIIIAGGFTTYNNTLLNGVARLNSDGSLDTSFNIGDGVNSSVLDIAIQNDGKIIISGWFTSYNNIPNYLLVRLNRDGSLDTSFSGDNNILRAVYAIALQNDGKIIIGGYFGKYGDTLINGIARLNNDGSLDETFKVGSGINYYAFALNLQSDGRIVVGGNFYSIDRATRFGIGRLNADGSLDASFNNEGGANYSILAMAAQSDGKTIIGGYFSTYRDTRVTGIARLNIDGSLDTSFDTRSSIVGASVRALAIQNDGKILVGGSLTLQNGTSPAHIARLNPDGSLDTSFATNIGPGDSEIYAIAIQNDGKIVVGGYFSTYNGISAARVTRLNTDGSLDTSFNMENGANSAIFAIKIQNDGKIIISGWFTSYNNTLSSRIARLNADGSLDISFNVGAGASGSGIFALALQNDGKIIIGGDFTHYKGVARKNIARLNSDGSLDTNFNVGSGASRELRSVAIQSNGKIIIGGAFRQYNDMQRTFLARLNYDGTLDISFNPVILYTGDSTAIRAIIVQNDEKILAGGSFTSVNNYTRGNIARLGIVSATSTKLTSSANPVQQGASLTFTATVTPAAATGAVTFSFNGGATATSPLVNGIATYMTNTLPIGVYTVKATYKGNANYTGSSSPSYSQKVEACSPLVVISTQDSGKADICGTFSYALLSASSGTTITFALPQGNTINFTGSLTPTLASGVNLDGGANGVILNGNGVAGDGLRLAGQNWLTNLTIRRFTGRELVVIGSQANKFYKVKVEN